MLFYILDSNEGKRRKKSAIEMHTTSAIEKVIDAICKEDKIVLPPPPEPNEMDSFLSLVGFRLQKKSSKSKFKIMQQILQLTYDIIIQEDINE